VSSSADSKAQQDTKEGREAERLATLEYLRAVRPGVDHVLQELVDEVHGVYGTDLCMVNPISRTYSTSGPGLEI
jgi:hypothetical protein